MVRKYIFSRYFSLLVMLIFNTRNIHFKSKSWQPIKCFDIIFFNLIKVDLINLVSERLVRCFDAEVVEVQRARFLTFDMDSSYKKKTSLKKWSKLTPV